MRIEEKQANRLQFMNLLYDITDGRLLATASVDAIASQLQWTSTEAQAVVNYLHQENLVRHEMGNQVSITHRGVIEVEEARTNPTRPTEHFAPMSLVFVGGNVIGSQLQTGTSHSSQHQDILSGSQREAVDTFLAEFRSALAHEDFPEEFRPEAEAYVAAADAQLGLARPNKNIIRESLDSLRAIAENLAASGIFVGLVALGSQILS